MKAIKDKDLKTGMIVTDVNPNTSASYACYFEVMKVDNKKIIYLKFINHPNGKSENDYFENIDGLSEFEILSDIWYLVEEDENN
jgi:ribosome-binding factor A